MNTKSSIASILHDPERQDQIQLKMLKRNPKIAYRMHKKQAHLLKDQHYYVDENKTLWQCIEELEVAGVSSMVQYEDENVTASHMTIDNTTYVVPHEHPQVQQVAEIMFEVSPETHPQWFI